MKLLLPMLLVAIPSFAQTQSDTVWTQFTKKEKQDYRYGYKDAAGRIRIPARFGNFTNAQKFRHIMAVNEKATQRMYYLLKNGREIGRDSVYMFDYTFDCESEGRIRFKDHQRDRMGFFDGRGKAAIPSIYCYVSPFHNGMAVGLIGARRKCWSGENDTVHCEHPGWVGGRNLLINERNEVLADNLPERQLDYLNWYSLRVNAPAIDTATTRTFRAVNGDRYTFTDYEKEFTHWFYEVFVPTVRTGAAGKFTALCYSELVISGRPFQGWQYLKRAAFIRKFYQLMLQPKLSVLQPGAKNVAVFSEDLNGLIFDSPSFQAFFTDCNEHFREKYPVFNVVVNPVDAAGKTSSEHQAHFAFIRTVAGYRLFSVAL
ncbi:hypothetical protein ACVWYF_001128 [Hymenobacter sp. UYAg731]